MAFLLGSFTDGLFGGAKDVMSIANEWEGLKQKRMLNKAAEDAMAATKDQQRLDKEAKDNWSPRGQNTSTASDPEKYTEPDFSSLPAPKFMSDKVTKEALPAKTPKAPKVDAPKTYLAPDKDKDTSPATALPTQPDPWLRLDYSNGASPEGIIGGVIRAGTAAGTAVRGALGFGDQSQQPTAPAYLPPQQPVGPNAPPAGPGTTDILQQHSALPAGTPNLASNQIGLGSRILSALGEGYNRSNLGQPYTPEEIARMSRGEAAATLAGAIPGSFLKNLGTLEQPYITPALREEARKKMYEGKQDWGVPEA